MKHADSTAMYKPTTRVLEAALRVTKKEGARVLVISLHNDHDAETCR